MYRIEADLLIPGRGEPVENGCVVLKDEEIAYAGPQEGAPSTPEAETMGVPAVMPGMWDCHGHFLGILGANVEVIARTPLPVLAARVAKDAERALLAGFTSVREPGGLGVHLARVVDEGTLPGPHIYAAGSFLSQTGGHGDLHAYPLELVAGMAEKGGYLTLCDGVPECLKAVRSQLRLGAKLIKVHASGGVMSELDHPIHQQFTGEELRAIVEEAARADRIVAAHCHGKPGIVAALEAGCRTIEHGTYLDEETAEEMIRREAMLVPTRFIIEAMVMHAQEAGVPDYAQDKMEAILDQHERALRLAVKKGVPMATGTDIFTSGEGPATWGMNGGEVAHLRKAGMTPLQAIEAATANGPLTLGPQAPRSGQLQPGYAADVIALRDNPLQDLALLARPGDVTHVWKAGTLVKQPRP